MKAEETLMSVEEIIANSYELNPTRFALAQAKLTYPLAFEEGKKAGYEERDKELVKVPLADLLERSYKAGVKDHAECCDIDYKAGMREVVEWLEGHKLARFAPIICSEGEASSIWVSREEWRTRVKEWGIES